MLQNLPKRRCALMNPCLALNRPWRPYMLCLSFVSQFPLGPRLRSRLLRPGGLRSHLFSPGGLRSRLFSPGGLRSCLLRLGTLLCWLCLGSWSRHFHMDLALRPSPGSTSAPNALLVCSVFGASGSRSLGGGAMSRTTRGHSLTTWTPAPH